ncbi:MAG: ATP-binding cassette domain-containing protein [Thermaerobacter sp.]|nr:ATP-binding cassette domain-containing protein [Thermaerobacter sp.]
MSKRRGARLVLQDVTLAVPAGTVVVVLGPNGSGKSTFLELAAGVWAPSRGRLERLTQGATTEATDPRVGYLGHRSFLYGALSGLDNLTFYARLYGVLRPRERAARLLAEVGLSRFQREPMRRNSGAWNSARRWCAPLWPVPNCCCWRNLTQAWRWGRAPCGTSGSGTPPPRAARCC